MTRQCIDICERGINLICIVDGTAKVNPYKIYRKWFEGSGWHRKKLNEFADFPDALEYIRDYYWSSFRGYLPKREFLDCKGQTIE